MMMVKQINDTNSKLPFFHSFSKLQFTFIKPNCRILKTELFLFSLLSIYESFQVPTSLESFRILTTLVTPFSQPLFTIIMYLNVHPLTKLFYLFTLFHFGKWPGLSQVVRFAKAICFHCSRHGIHYHGKFLFYHLSPKIHPCLQMHCSGYSSSFCYQHHHWNTILVDCWWFLLLHDQKFHKLLQSLCKSQVVCQCNEFSLSLALAHALLLFQ